jgi:hypothetical protein
MRCLLFAAGLVALALGVCVSAYGEPFTQSDGALLVLAGASFFAVGSASIDVVEALWDRHRT